MERKLYKAGLAVFAGLIALSVAFYKERIIGIDSAFSFFDIVNNAGFCIQLNRYGEGLSQILPVLLRKMYAPLGMLAVSYSVNFVLVQLGCYLICGSVLKQYRWALVILLGNVLIAADSFFWPISQLPQGLALLAVYFALLSADIDRLRPNVTYLAAFALLFFIMLLHPAAIATLLYVVGFLWLRNSSNDRGIALRTGIAMLLIFGIKMLLLRNAYETHALSGLRNFVTLFPNYFDTAATREFIHQFVWKFGLWSVLLALTIRSLLRNRATLLAAYTTVAAMGLLLLVNVAWATEATPTFYRENLYLPLVTIIAVPMLQEVLPKLNNTKWVYLFASAVFVTAFVRIPGVSAKYVARLNWERHFLQQYGDRKMIADSAKAGAAPLQMVWCTPYEFWLLSTLETEKSASIIIDGKPHERNWASEQRNALVVNWNLFPYAKLPKQYFVFEDTTSGYEIDPDLKQ